MIETQFLYLNFDHHSTIFLALSKNFYNFISLDKQRKQKANSMIKVYLQAFVNKE